MGVTWTLRVYDSDGVEIAWVRADPYECEITHPDSGWEGVRDTLRNMESGDERVGDVHLDGYVFHDDDPKEHLEWVQENMVPGPDADIDSTTLKDE
jgi:hypothetical protein